MIIAKGLRGVELPVRATGGACDRDRNIGSLWVLAGTAHIRE